MKYFNLKCIHKISVQAVLILALVISSIPVYSTVANAVEKCDKEFYSNNDILFYDPCETTCSGGSGGGSVTGPAPSSLTGADNEEKAWNYFAARGLTPIAAAGAMGNIKAESGFNAAVEERSGGGGLGIIQWTGSRRTDLESAAAKAGVNLADNDSALLFELNYLWDGEYNAMTWQEQTNAETTVEGNTAIASYNKNFSSQLAESQAGNGSTMVFHALVERSGDVPTEADRIDNFGVLTHRIDNAKAYLEKFSGASSTAGSCEVSAGGLTWDQAVAAAKKLSANWDSIYCGDGSVKNGFYCGPEFETGYCTAGTAWLAEITAPDKSKVPPIPDGVNVAKTFITSNPDVYVAGNPDGSNLQPFSIWSFGIKEATGGPGHTGTIVSVGTDGSIITLEANISGKTDGSTKDFLTTSGRKFGVFEYPSFEVFKNSHNGYVFNAVATPKDKATAAQMATKITPFTVGNN